MSKTKKVALSAALIGLAIDGCRGFPMVSKALTLLDDDEITEVNPAAPVDSYPPRINDIHVMWVQDIDNNVYGPFSKNQVRECIADERIDSQSLVCFCLGRTLKGKEIYSQWISFGSSGWKEMAAPSRPAITQYTPRAVLPTYNIQFWFLDAANEPHGPFNTLAIPALKEQGLINSNTLAYVEHGPYEWRRIGDVSALSKK